MVLDGHRVTLSSSPNGLIEENFASPLLDLAPEKS